MKKCLLPLFFLLTITSAWAASPLVKQLQDHVVVPEGSSFVPTSLDGTKDYYLLYYSAHWCPPCRKFTPVFVKAYNELREKGIDNFEVILVGYDYTEDKMLHYMEIAHMPWLAVDYSKRKDIPIVNDLAARGIPNLVVLNRAGNVLLRTYVGDTYVGPYKVLEDFVKLVDPL